MRYIIHLVIFKMPCVAIFDLNMKMSIIIQIPICHLLLELLIHCLLYNAQIFFSTYYNFSLSWELLDEVSVFLCFRYALFFMHIPTNMFYSSYASQTCIFNLYDLLVIVKRQHKTSINQTMN